MNDHETAKAILELKGSDAAPVEVRSKDGETLLEISIALLKKWAKMQVAVIKGGKRSKRPPEKFDEASVANRERVRRFRAKQKNRTGD